MDKIVTILLFFVLILISASFVKASPGAGAGAGNSKEDEKESYSITLESELRDEVFETYEKLQRPEEETLIKISLSLLTVNDMDIIAQEMTFSGYLHVQWYDARLKWMDTNNTSKDYTSVNFMFTSVDYIWTPPIVISNSAKDISVIGSDNLPIRIDSKGDVTWNPSGLFKVSCEASTTYYPLDIQTCAIQISSWSYTRNEVKLDYGTISVDTNSYSRNGEWNLISVTVTETPNGDTIVTRGSVSFSSVTFVVKLQRRPIFHILNIVLPVFMMAILIAAVFKVPVESGERIGFSLTVLLAYALYLMIVSGSIPSTSLTVCLLSLYLIFTLALGTAAVVLTLIVLTLHNRPDTEDVSRWLVCISELNQKMHRGICLKRENRVKTTKDEVTKVNNLDKYTCDKYEKETDQKLTWRVVSRTIDRVSFNVYIILIIIMTISFLAVITQHYFSK